MIQINLLPPELQKAARTPKTLFFTLTGGVALCTVLGFTTLWLWISLSSLKDDVDRRRVDVSLVKDKASEVERINEDIAFYKEREKAIIKIKSKRILWTQKLEQLVRRTPGNIWITRMALDTLDPAEYKWEKGKRQVGGMLKLTCYAQGSEVATLSDYRAALSGHRIFYKDLIDVRTLPDNFFGDFIQFSNPSWTQVHLDGFAQPRSLRFVLEAHLKPLYDQPDAKKGAS